MSRVRADRFSDREGSGAPRFDAGIVVAGVSTFSGNVSIAGTLTYDDVTNIDSVGLITARSGIIATGIVTATSFHGDGSALSGTGIAGVSTTGHTTLNTLVSAGSTSKVMFILHCWNTTISRITPETIFRISFKCHFRKFKY